MNKLDSSITPMGRRRDSQKDELDKQTSYLTLLPHMDEGFHSGYQAIPGIVCDQNQRPREWLESVARYMQTQGEDVGYSIPDVLASEQQLRRLSRLPHEIAMRHQEMLDYRAVLALLLLWDSWPKDDTWPLLTLERMDMEGSGFASSVRAALTPERAREGLFVFTLMRPRAEPPDARPLCLLSRAMVLMPAADPGDLGELLPAHVTWYDPKRKRFNDPCAYLDESDLSRLLLQLRLLQALNERAELDSLIYSPQAQLCGLLDRFINDLLNMRAHWRKTLETGDEAVARALHLRALAVYGLRARTDGAAQRLSERTIQLTPTMLAQNPLIHSLLPPGFSLPPNLISDSGLTLYLLDGVPFARQSSACLLEPTRSMGEEIAMSKLSREIDILNRFSPEWNRDISVTFSRLRKELAHSVGMSNHVLALLTTWSAAHAHYPPQSERSITLQYPMREYPASLAELLKDMLCLTDEQCIRSPFSDCLLVMEEAECPPYDDAALDAACLIDEGGTDAPPRYAAPPLSPFLCAWLQACGERDDLFAPQLEPDSLRFVLNKERNRIDASFRLVCRTRAADAVTINSVTFRRSYEIGAQFKAGTACPMSASELPFVTVWPNVRLAPGLWRQYFVYTHRPSGIDVWTLTNTGWAQGEHRCATDEGARRQAHVRKWQTARTERFPAYVALKRGELTVGALVNVCQRQPLRHEPAATVGVDFGSIATTVMLRQGDKVQPAVLPRCLHRFLLRLAPADERFLPDELLPKAALLPDEEGGGSTFYSVVDMFVDEPERWRDILRDGHIYYRESLGALLRKSENTLYYDMKWGEEDYILRLIRLFLSQVMAQASLSARLWGSPAISWRVSMPNAMPMHRQEAFLELIRGLSREVAQDTGMPLSRECPAVLYATENQADGLYFLGRNEVNAHNGYLNMDIGGSTTDISLWLNNAKHATAECSLLLGCRQMLFDSISIWHVADFEQDFQNAPTRVKTAVQNIVHALAQGISTTRGRQKCMFLLDDFFADCAPEIRAVMAQTRAQGHICYLESVLLFNIGFLFSIMGELINHVWLDKELYALLPSRMELCIAGNGGQLLKAFDDEQREKLCRLALSRLSSEHPLTALLPVQSRHPKQEVAIGLLTDDNALQSALQGVDRWNGTLDGDESVEQADLLRAYLPLFYRTFPQAAKRLMPNAFEGDGARGGARLTPTSSMELDTIFENERRKTPGDDMAAYVRCFAGLKRLWRI